MTTAKARKASIVDAYVLNGYGAIGIMSKTFLTNEALEFSKHHILAFYDTDFSPKPSEFEAIWYCWADVKNYLLSKPLSDVFTAVPRALPWLKARGGYRVVHQLEPLDAIIYTALIHSVASDIESARMDATIACSYRIDLDRDSFFARGSGFTAYRSSCERLSEVYSYVLLTDVSDFYNQIYLHRINNSVASASGDAKLGLEIENFLSRLNNKASQGIPIGPPASIILAEAVMVDVDQFISTKHVEHVRYVDDIRIFSDSESELREILEDLVIYLHDNHRLGLVSEKTKVIETSKFLAEELQNQYQIEKLEILSDIEVGNQYGMGADTQESEDEGIIWDDECEQEDSEEEGEELSLDQKLLDALQRARDFGYVDLAVLRAIIRRAKMARSSALMDYILDDLEFFGPIINDVALYFAAVPWEESEQRISKFSKACAEGLLTRKSYRVWFEWLFTRKAFFLKDRAVKKFVYEGSVQFASEAARLEKNMSWSKDAKQKILSTASWNRRAYLQSLINLSKDERDKYLSFIGKNPLLTETDRCICKWVKDGCPPFVDYFDDFDDMDF